METSKAKELKRIFNGKIKFGISMDKYTSYRIGGKCWAMAFPEEIQEISNAVSFCSKNKISYLAIGRGTNILVSDKGFNGLIINLARAFNRFEILDNPSRRYKRIFSQGGTNLSLLIKRLGKQGIGSLEFACGIPGTVGGGIKGNAGSFGKCLSDKVERLQIIDPKGEIKELTRKELSFGYRSCNLPDGCIIAGAWFKLEKRNKKNFDKLIANYRMMRKKAQPGNALTAGSVFKNPNGYSAGRLIELAGLKGVRCGGAYVSTKHGNFIINEGRARAREVYKLISKIREKVWEKFKIRLELELVLVGEGFE